MGEHQPPPRLPPWRGWAPILILPPAVLLLTPASWPRWAFMWAICAALFAGVKWLTWRRTPAPNAPLWRHLGYLIAWPGLDAIAFLHGPRPPRPTAWEWLDATGTLVRGIGVGWAK